MDVIVIGGGIVGSAATYHLARAGVRVTLVDRRDPGHATAAGAGIIAPGISITPPPAFFDLALPATEYYGRILEWLAEDGETDTGFDIAGLLFVAINEAEAERLGEIQRLGTERHRAGMRYIGEITAIDSDEARERFPALGPVTSALFVPEAARVDGRLLRDALQRAAQKRGATIVQGSAEPVREGDRVTEVVVDGDRLRADVVLIAGGAWSTALGAGIGIDLPVYPQRGQILHLDMPDATTGHWPIVEGFHSHYIVPFGPNRIVAGATREHDAGFDYRMTAAGVHESLSEALRIAPGLGHATLREIRVGFRPASPDSLPILGRAPGIENVFLATGHGPGGLQLGPYSGAAVADLARGEPVAADLAPFAVERFA